MNICIFCSSSNNIDNHYFSLSNQLADKISKMNHTLIYGAGMIGLMGEVSRTFKKNNQKIIGIIPERLNVDGVASTYDDEQIVTKDMHSRKAKMFEVSDAFIILPGGFGTIEELLEIITLKQLQYHNKPIVLYNINKFYDNLLMMFDVIYNEKFANEKFKNLYFVSENINEIIDYLNNYSPSKPSDKFDY